MDRVGSRSDPVFPIAVGRRLAAELDAQLVVMPRARHLPNAEHPHRFVAEIEAFLDATDDDTGSRSLAARERRRATPTF